MEKEILKNNGKLSLNIYHLSLKIAPLVLSFLICFLFKNNAEKIFLFSIVGFLILLNLISEFLLKKLHPNKKSQMFIGVIMGSMFFKMVFISLVALVFYKKHPETSNYVLVALMFQYLLLTVYSILRLQKIVRS